MDPPKSSQVSVSIRRRNWGQGQKSRIPSSNVNVEGKKAPLVEKVMSTLDKRIVKFNEPVRDIFESSSESNDSSDVSLVHENDEPEIAEKVQKPRFLTALDDEIENSPPKKSLTKPIFAAPPLANTSVGDRTFKRKLWESPKREASLSMSDKKMFYSVMFAKPSTRKNKVWESDGFVIVSGKTVVLKSTSGQVLETSFKCELSEEMKSECKTFKLGSKEVQIQEELSEDPFGDNVEKDENSNETETKSSAPVFKRIKKDDSPQEPIKLVPIQKEEALSNSKKYYSAMFSRPSNRKHKTWEGDGFLIVCGRNVVLTNTSGVVLERSFKCELSEEMTSECKTFNLGSKEVQIQEELESSPFEDLGKNETSFSIRTRAAESLAKKMKLEVPQKLPNKLWKNSKTEKRFYLAKFDKPSIKKDKVLEGEGILTLSGKSIILKDMKGELVECSFKSELTEEMLNDGKEFRLGNKLVQIQGLIAENPLDDPEFSQKRLSDNSDSEETTDEEEEEEATTKKIQSSKFFSAMYAKASTRKHKMWEGDGFIIISGKSVMLKNAKGQTIASSYKCELSNEIFSDCKIFKLGSKDVQIQEEISQNPFEDDAGIPAFSMNF